ncbi:MAG TPA: 50S ribosomal protein L34 [Armatimonadota bacterium]
MKKGTYQPKRKSRLRKHGFRARMATKSGRRIVNKRRRQGRRSLSL